MVKESARRLPGKISVSFMLALLTVLLKGQEVMTIVLYPSLSSKSISRELLESYQARVMDEMPEAFRPEIDSFLSSSSEPGPLESHLVNVYSDQSGDTNILSLDQLDKAKVLHSLAMDKNQNSSAKEFVEDLRRDYKEFVRAAEELAGRKLLNPSDFAQLQELMDNGMLDDSLLDGYHARALREINAGFLADVHALSPEIMRIQTSGLMEVLLNIFYSFSKKGLLLQSRFADCESLARKGSAMNELTLSNIYCHFKGKQRRPLLLNTSVLTNKILIGLLAISNNYQGFQKKLFFSDMKAQPITLSVYSVSDGDGRLYIDGYMGKDLLQLCPGKIKKCLLSDFTDVLESSIVPDYLYFWSQQAATDELLTFSFVLFSLSVSLSLMAIVYDCLRRKLERKANSSS